MGASACRCNSIAERRGSLIHEDVAEETGGDVQEVTRRLTDHSCTPSCDSEVKPLENIEVKRKRTGEHRLKRGESMEEVKRMETGSTAFHSEMSEKASFAETRSVERVASAQLMDFSSPVSELEGGTGSMVTGSVKHGALESVGSPASHGQGSDATVPGLPRYSSCASNLQYNPFHDHLVLRHLEDEWAIRFLLAEALPGLAPWPRCQDLPRHCFHRPQATDLVVAVSHAWYYQTHPDPLGEKAQLIDEYLAKAAEVLEPKGKSCAFIDFLSIPQQPFASGQKPRTASEEEAFFTALKSMPSVYLYADAVLLLDVPAASSVPEEGTIITVKAEELSKVNVLEVGGYVQIAGFKDSEGDQGKSKVAPFDILLTIDGKPVTSVAVARAMLAGRGIGKKPQTATVQKAPYGLKNTTSAMARGWIYLEHFIAMVKVAMSGGEDRAERIVFSNSPQVIDRIREGAEELREAVKSGPGALTEVLEMHLQQLSCQVFSGTSTDRLTNNGVQPGRTVEMVGTSDHDVVAEVMKGMVRHLESHWAEEAQILRQRKIFRAVIRLRALSRLCKPARPLFRGFSMEKLRDSVRSSVHN